MQRIQNAQFEVNHWRQIDKLSGCIDLAVGALLHVEESARNINNQHETISMTQEQLIKNWDVAVAFKEGKQVQWFTRIGNWEDYKDTATIDFLNPLFEWRVKPVPREYWVCWHQRGHEKVYPIPEYSEDTVSNWPNYIKVVEVPR